MTNNYKLYITERDKKYIENYCKVQMEHKDLIRIKSIAVMLENKYAMYEIMQYIKQDLGISKDKIFHGEADYIVKLPRGHIQLVNDLYFNNCYLHQYIISMELDIPMEQIQKYIIHHLNMQKDTNDINNLWIFYDQASHQAYHQLLKKGIIQDIKQFTMDYMEDILATDNAAEVKKYLEILDILEKKNKLLNATNI